MRSLLLPLTLLLSAPAFPGQEKEDITIDWIFGDEAEEVTALPLTYWTSTGELLLWDSRRPKAERTLERVQPDTGARTPAVDAKAALASLRTLLGDKDAPEALGWPPSVDRAGRTALYVFGGDLYVLDLASSTFVYFTSREKSPVERHLYRIGLDGSGRQRLSREDGTHVVRWSPDRRHYLDARTLARGQRRERARRVPPRRGPPDRGRALAPPRL